MRVKAEEEVENVETTGTEGGDGGRERGCPDDDDDAQEESYDVMGTLEGEGDGVGQGNESVTSMFGNHVTAFLGIPIEAICVTNVGDNIICMRGTSHV